MRARVTIGALTVPVGAVWVGQGLGVLQGRSFMVGDSRWAIVGIGLMLIGAAVLLDARRRRS